MSFNSTNIRNHVLIVKSWNPITEIPDELFKYIDLSSINKDLKNIEDRKVSFILGIDAPSRARQIVCENDVLISTVRPNLNGVAILNKKYQNGTASTGYCILRTKQSLDSKYLFYWVQSNYFIKDMIKKATGANYPAVSDRIIKESKIPLPPLPTQKKIAAILDEADRIRQLNKQLIKKYDELTQSLFLDMFGDPVINPMGWKKIELNEIASKLGDGIHGTPIYDVNGDYYFGLCFRIM